ncbi:serine hydrolase domain-containing protein [Algoriphagus halophilus]|uniref:Beta-lactamase n=1 Tax=Algoriphagus halophilus TaxID=226505 RepID=A0A1N6D9D3_9BACT|nr:serine hydrolase domain-containing protein [Algoriphagus halophilus]SIN67296.1 Beta-lactamase [Algoriphagus halophilus]
MTKSRSKNLLRIFLLVGTVISLFYVPWTWLFAWMAPLSVSVQEEVNQGLELGFEGIIVYVNQAGKEPQFYAAGWHDRDQKIPAYPQALFKIASISKLYDAVAIAKLVHAQRLSLDQSLAEYFPEYADRIEHADQITLRMLVQHRSGIPNYTNHPGFWENPPDSFEETMDLILDLPAGFAPGEGYEYSNTNYLLISRIIKNELGYPKFQFIQEEVLSPLGLKHTYGSFHEAKLEDLMSGYYEGIEEDIKTAEYGSMVSSAEDVGIFLRALNDGSLFKKGEKEIYSSIYVYDHTGLIPGYQSIAKYHQDLDAVVIQFTNTTNFEGMHWNLSELIYSRILKIIRREKGE